MLQKTGVAPLGCLGTPREQSRSTEWGHLAQTIARRSTHPPIHDRKRDHDGNRRRLHASSRDAAEGPLG